MAWQEGAEVERRLKLMSNDKAQITNEIQILKDSQR
jgi:hypothetical protein